MGYKYIFVIAGLPFGFTNAHGFTPPAHMGSKYQSISTWYDWLSIENSNIKISEKIDPFTNDNTISNIRISILNGNIGADSLFTYLFKMKEKFVTTLTSDISRDDTAADTFTVADASTLDSPDEIWINKECFNVTVAGNTCTIIERTYYITPLQYHKAHDEDSQIFTYVHSDCAGIIGNRCWLYEYNDQSDEDPRKIYHGCVEGNLELKNGMIEINISSWINLLKTPIIKKYNQKLNLHGISLTGINSAGYKVWDFLSGQPDTFFPQDLPSCGYSIENYVELFNEAGGSNEGRKLQMELFANKINLAIIQPDTGDQYARDCYIVISKNIQGLMGLDSKYNQVEGLKWASFFKLDGEFDLLEYNISIGTNNSSDIENGTWIKIYCDEAESDLAEGDYIICESDDFSFCIEIDAVDNDDGHYYFEGWIVAIDGYIESGTVLTPENSSFYRGWYKKSTFVNLLDSIGTLGDGFHPEIWDESDLDVNQFRRLLTYDHYSAWVITKKTNIYDLLKNYCKLSNVILYVNASGKCTCIDAETLYTSTTCTVLKDCIPSIKQIPSIQKIIIQNYQDREVYKFNANNTLNNIHVNYKSDTIKMNQSDIDQYYKYIVPAIYDRLNLFGRNLAEIQFDSIEDLLVGGSYELDSEFIDNEFRYIIIIEKNKYLNKYFSYTGLCFIETANKGYAPSAVVTSYNSGTKTGTCDSIQQFNLLDDNITDLDYFDDIKGNTMIVYNSAGIVEVEIDSINIVAKTVTFKTDCGLTAPFILTIPSYASASSIEKNSSIYICDKDDQMIDDEDLGESWGS